MAYYLSGEFARKEVWKESKVTHEKNQDSLLLRVLVHGLRLLRKDFSQA